MKAKMADGLEIFIESVNYIIISYALSNMALLFWRNLIDAFDSALSATETRRFTVGKKVPITWGEAALFRIQNQSDGYSAYNPNGAYVIGWGGK